MEDTRKRCRKCGRLLAESNKGKLCEVCKADTIERIKSKTLISVCCLTIVIFIGVYLWSIKNILSHMKTALYR